MPEMQLGVVEARFADIIWGNEPLSSAEVVKLAEKELGWKKSTTYTVLKRLCEKGIFKNENGKVSSLISKSEFYALQSERFVEETFAGSLPAFLAAFTKRKALSKEEIASIRKLIEEHKED
jgi:predicted transcriptional regulator